MPVEQKLTDQFKKIQGGIKKLDKDVTSTIAGFMDIGREETRAFLASNDIALAVHGTSNADGIPIVIKHPDDMSERLALELISLHMERIRECVYAVMPEEKTTAEEYLIATGLLIEAGL